jgi:uncharacterized protein (DUF1499 family)
MAEATENRSENQELSKVALAALVLSVLAILVGAFSGFGSRWGWWHFGTGFTMLRWAVYIGIAGLVFSIIGIFHARPSANRQGFTAALLGLILGALIVTVPVSYLMRARSVPPIHDITTDTQNPPQFDVVTKLRADAPNPLEYGGPDIAKQQKAAYPGIQPLNVDMSPDQAYEHALEAAQSMGWTIQNADESAHRIEATDVTFWYGFKDDIVIRVQTGEDGSRIDVRSISRVGKSDVGKNAERIRNYMDKLQQVINTSG